MQNLVTPRSKPGSPTGHLSNSSSSASLIRVPSIPKAAPKPAAPAPVSQAARGDAWQGGWAAGKHWVRQAFMRRTSCRQLTLAAHQPLPSHSPPAVAHSPGSCVPDCTASCQLSFACPVGCELAFCCNMLAGPQVLNMWCPSACPPLCRPSLRPRPRLRSRLRRLLSPLWPPMCRPPLLSLPLRPPLLSLLSPLRSLRLWRSPPRLSPPRWRRRSPLPRR